MAASDASKKIFTAEEMTGVAGYCFALAQIHKRLVMEGYFLDDGKTWNIFKVGKIICSFLIESG